MVTEFLKRHPTTAFFLIWLGCAIAGVVGPNALTVLDYIDKWLADIRLTTMGVTTETRPDIVIFTITEDTLALHPYRFPIDRAMVAGAIEQLNRVGVRAIGLDILFDQATEPEKDKRLNEAVANSAAPVIVGWASEADGLTQKQMDYLERYLPDALHAPSNLAKDDGDGTVRWLYPGTNTDTGYRIAFAPALARAAGVQPNKKIQNLYYRRTTDKDVAPFSVFPLNMLKTLPTSWYAGKIVLIGADLPNEDRHRTPFASLLGNDAGSLPGVLIHGHALAQLIDGVQFSRSNRAHDLLTAALAAGLGVGIALLGIGVLAKLVLCGIALSALWITGFAVFAIGGPLLPLFAPSVTFASAISLSAAVLSQRYKHKKQIAEARVHRRNQTLHQVVENSFDGIIVTTSEGTIVMTNSSADLIMGWKAGETSGSSITDHISNVEQYGSHFLEIDGDVRPSRMADVQPLEVDCQRRDGTCFTMELVIYVARVSFSQQSEWADSGERVSNIYSFRDVTARRLAAEAREQALQQAEAANRAKTEFLHNMSHELRTPLNAIIGFSELIKTEALGPIGTPQYLEYATDIHGSGSRLIDIINDILDMSKIETGELQPNPEIFNVGGVADSTLRLIADRAEKGNVTVTDALPDTLPSLYADQRMIKQILLNLLSNAVKFTPAEGVVTLTGTANKSGLTISVSDTGCGIPQDKMDVILEPFGQADMSLQREFEGTGLGLPLVKSMIELLGGKLSIESVVGSGTTASIWLPPECLRHDGFETISGAEETDPDKSLRVLVAEDNHVNKQIVAAMLTPLDCEIDFADTGFEAVSAVQSADYDVVLMDIQMPVMDGIEATEQIRAIGGSKGEIPIIAVTAKSAQSDRDYYLNAGCNDFVAKPIDQWRLLNAVCRITGATMPNTETSLSAAAESVGSDRVTSSKEASQENDKLIDELDDLLDGTQP